MRHLRPMLLTFVLTASVLTTGGLSSGAWQDDRLPSGFGLGQNRSGGTGGRRLAPQELEPIAIAIVATNNGLPVDLLMVTSSATAKLRLTGRSVHSFHIRDKRNGRRYDVTLDEKGNQVDEEYLRAQERAAHVAKYGKLETELAERLVGASPEDTIQVVIRLKVPPDTSDKPQDPSSESDNKNWASLTEQEKTVLEKKEEEYEKKRDDYLANRARKLLAPVVDRLTNLGYKVTNDKYAPLIYVYLTPAAVKMVEQWEEVVEISISGTGRSSLDVSRVTVGASYVENRGWTGTGVQVAQVELQGGRVLNNTGQNNAWLAGVVQDQVLVCATAGQHAVAVAGVIRCTNTLPPGARGVAPGVTLWAGGTCGNLLSDAENRATAAADWGAKAINLSYNGSETNSDLTAHDRFFDRMVYERSKTIVAAAGNSTCSPGNGNVRTPGKGYNVITVGGFNDFDTVSWTGDGMYVCSSWTGPNSGSGDREKPEIVAPAVSITTTIPTVPWLRNIFADGTSISGTSFAAPHVTGAAALLIQTHTGLKSRPEALKAILLASAAHDIVGPDNYQLDGLGGLVVDWAQDVVLGTPAGRGWGLINPYDCNTFPNPYLGTTLLNLQAGRLTRVVIVWNTSPDYYDYQNRPMANLDLEVYDPSGNLMSPFGDSVDNTYEFIYFYPPVNGNYPLYVRANHCDISPGRVGFAYWQQ